MTPQREFGATVVACLAGAGLSLYAASRVWSVHVTVRPGLTNLRSTTTGAAHTPWLVGLALVALAGAGALLATHGVVRRVLGVVLIVTGAGLLIAAIAGRLDLDAGAAGAAATFWPIVCVLSGALIVWGGLTAARHGRLWPAMSSRYERRPATARPSTTPGPTESPAPDAEPAGEAPEPATITSTGTREAWEALDRGDDPTLR
jgi:uncharacterized membrane protein (TIGR02234 family)